MTTHCEKTRQEIYRLLDMVQKQIVATTTQLELLTEQYTHLVRMWEETEQREVDNV
jgi:uncharacterized protein YuzB (UPF0349 family)